MFALLPRGPEKAGVFVLVFKAALGYTGSIKAFLFSFLHAPITVLIQAFRRPGVCGCVCTFLQTDNPGSQPHTDRLCDDDPEPGG